MFEVNQQTIQDFLSIKNKKELAKVLGIKYHILIYNLHVLEEKEKYTEFQIKKKNGGYRDIIAPSSGIKEIQKRLSKILLDLYVPKPCTHSYIPNYGIKSNASKHLRKKFVINVDLKDFFPSINFGRVQGLFQSHPFKFNKRVSIALAQICCYQGALPQGAPTSPIISNYICRNLDNSLMKASKVMKCNFTRYADDLTFSTNTKKTSSKLGTIKRKKLVLSIFLKDIIESNDFKINETKVRYGDFNSRQEVTGIKVNKKLNVDRNYIKKIRAMLNAWEKYGIYNAAHEHYQKYLGLENLPNDIEILFEKKLVGMIGFVGHIKGKQDRVYHKLLNKIKSLSPEVKLSLILRQDQLETMPVVYGEGKSDWKHLLAAHNNLKVNGLYNDLYCVFHNYKDHEIMNNTELLKMCESLSHFHNVKNKHIFIFDRDDHRIIKNVSDKVNEFKRWGNNIYSFVIPKPSHRNFDQVCIEHYYKDDEIKTVDDNGRRLFLSSEFDKFNGKHINERFSFENKKRLNAPYPAIIEHSVLNEQGENIALPKNDFASNVLFQKEGFNNFSFNEFKLIFNIIKNIIESE